MTLSCSDGSRSAGEQLAGSAPYARAWVALEQNGPWGAKAFTASHLDPDLGRAIESTATVHDVRPALIRRPGRHSDVPASGAAIATSPPDKSADPRRVLVAWTDPAGAWLLDGVLPGPADLLGLDWAALARGDRDAVIASLPWLAPSDTAHLLVCTNGTRDVCCAVKGRPLATALAAAHPGRVWEVTHTSGHRFAPTAVLLPAGTLHGRLDPAAGTALLGAAGLGRTVLEGSRGRSTFPPPAQVAELAVREETGELSLAALTVSSHAKAPTAVDPAGARGVDPAGARGVDPVAAGDVLAWRTVVRHRDGRAWEVLTRSAGGSVVRPESCGKAALPLRTWTAEVTPLP